MDFIRQDRISVCACTFKRPKLLARLLESLAAQKGDESFAFDVVVVDNDRKKSAEDTVRAFQRRSDLQIIYDCEPEQNIALTRNRAVRNATGNLIAFIDDDEHASCHWLCRLHQVLLRYQADGALGPVLPHFPDGAPQWLQKGDFFDRRRLETGSTITHRDARTGNVLLRRSLFPQGETWFDPAFGRTGGEDADFFRRQFQQGRKFVWCDEAVAYETVPPNRWTAAFHIRKFLRIGSTSGRVARQDLWAAWPMLVQHGFVLGGFAMLLPLTLLAGKHRWVQVMTKMAYRSGFLLSALGLMRGVSRD